MLQIIIKPPKRQRIVRSGCDALVHDDAKRHTADKFDLPVLADGDLTRVAHRHDHGGGTEVVNVMVNVICTNARKIRDRHAAMERACLDDAFGQQAVLVHPFQQADRHAAQPRDLQQRADEIVRGIGVARFPIAVDVLVHRVLHVEDGVGRLKVHLVHRTLVFARLEHHHADRDLVARIDALVYNEPIQKRMLRDRADVCCDDQRQMRDRLPFLPLLVEISLHRLLYEIDLDHIHGVVALVHHVRRDLVHRLHRLDASSVFSHGSPSIVLFHPCIQNHVNGIILRNERQELS